MSNDTSSTPKTLIYTFQRMKKEKKKRKSDVNDIAKMYWHEKKKGKPKTKSFVVYSCRVKYKFKL